MESSIRRGRVCRAVASLLFLSAMACERAAVPSPNRLETSGAPPMRESDGLLSDSALQAVVSIQNDGAVAGLLRTLYNGSSEERVRAAWAAASIREPFAYQGIQDQIGHPDPEVRASAAFALSTIPRAQAAVVLGRALETEADSAVRRHFVDALGFVGRAETARALAAGSFDVPEPSLMAAVARIAVSADSTAPVVLDRLIAGLHATDGETREMAAWYFGRAEETGAWDHRIGDVREALDGLAPDDPAARGLLRALERLADPTDVPRLVRFETSPDWRVRVRMAAALGPVAAEDEARATLFRALDDASTHVAVSAAGALGQLRRLLDVDQDRIEAWIDEHPDDWRTAAPLLEALAAQGRAGYVRGWLEARNGEELAVRVTGIQALARAPDQGVTRSLMDLASSDTVALAIAALHGLTNRWPAERANRELHQAYWDAFGDALRGRDRGVVATVAPVMPDSVFVDLGGIALLEEAYRSLTPLVDVEAALAVVDALGATGRLEAIPSLQIAMGDEHLVVRDRALRLAEQLAGRRALGETHASPVGRTPDWERIRALGPRPRLVLQTEKGRVVIGMATELAPVTVQTVAEFADAGLYDGVPFHRVVPDFVIQGGDFERGDGFGGPGFTIRTELTGIPFRRGVVGMASSGPDTEGSQFFITHSAQPHLDRSYTSFGWVEEGMEVVDSIYQGERILRATVEPDAPALAAGADSASR